MPLLANTDLQAQLDTLDRAEPERISRSIDMILKEAVRQSASDVHFEPIQRCVEVRFRLDGVLHRVASLGVDLAPNLIARLKVLAELLTYRLDIPQEGRIPNSHPRYGVEMRVSTFPIIHGERAVVRLFDAQGRVLDLDQLGLPEEVKQNLIRLLRQRLGALLLTGPSGSGKTTTIYACLRHLVRQTGGGQHIVTIEDPVEQVLEGVSQSQARPGTSFDFARGLRSVLRQDPEILMIGEVRDPETAAIAIEAALTGHLVVSTVHAGSACGVLSRLLDMGIEPYLLTSALTGILNQRLVRRLCSACQPRSSETTSGPPGNGNGPLCNQCAGTGYRGRLLLAELLLLDGPLRQAVLARSDTKALEEAATRPGRQTLWAAAQGAVEGGLTTGSEIERVLGPH